MIKSPSLESGEAGDWKMGHRPALTTTQYSQSIRRALKAVAVSAKGRGEPLRGGLAHKSAIAS